MTNRTITRADLAEAVYDQVCHAVHTRIKSPDQGSKLSHFVIRFACFLSDGLHQQSGVLFMPDTMQYARVLLQHIVFVTDVLMESVDLLHVEA